MSEVYELWRREYRSDGHEGIYRWMVWHVGPVGSEAHEWFETYDEARARIDELLEGGSQQGTAA